MVSDRSAESIPKKLSEFIDFFGKNLTGVQFPDVDGDRLTAQVARIRQHAQGVAELEEKLRHAREGLSEAQAELLRVARRGLAYARVFADGDVELTEKLEALELARERAESKQPRKRKSKSNSERRRGKKPTAELPFSGTQPEVPEAA